MEFDVFSIRTWPLLTTSSADTLSEVRSRHTWMVVKVSKLVARFHPSAVLHLSHSSQSFPIRCKSIFAMSPLETLHGFSFSLRAKTMVLTMAKGSARLVPSPLSAHFLSPCRCSNHSLPGHSLTTGSSVCPCDLYLPFLPPGMHGSIVQLLQDLCLSGPLSEKPFVTTLRKGDAKLNTPFFPLFFFIGLSSSDISCIYLWICLLPGSSHP